MRNPFETPKSPVRNDLRVSADPPERPTATDPTRARGRKRIDYPASLSPTELDIAKAAGFYDGEGHVTINQNQYTVVIGQNDRETIDWLQARFGGKVYGPYLIKSTGNLRHELKLVRERALDFMYAILKYLPEDRKEQFKATLEGKPQCRIYRQAFTPNGVDEAYIVRKLKQLQRKRDRENKSLKGMQIFGVKK